ncbi:MAG TPA: hypothetical protein VK929_10990 [Longimicrobiales bacterium]|nr:hypothetical protein [Longimicrobiales bacterium]
MRKSTFVVGRRLGQKTVVIYVAPVQPSPIIGPWTVEAVVSSN